MATIGKAFGIKRNLTTGGEFAPFPLTLGTNQLLASLRDTTPLADLIARVFRAPLAQLDRAAAF